MRDIRCLFRWDRSTTQNANKGNQARYKKEMENHASTGYETDGGGLFEIQWTSLTCFRLQQINPFREALVADLQALSGGFSQEVFPMRVERNNDFLAYSCTANPLTRVAGLHGIQLEVYVWKAELVSKLNQRLAALRFKIRSAL